MLPLLPYPQQVREGTGIFRLRNNASVHVDRSIPTALGERLVVQVAQSAGVTLVPTIDTSPIALSLSDRTRIHCGPESYELTVTAGEIRIAGADETGLSHGVETLTQLIERADGKTVVPAVEIEDWPQFAWRGCHLDVARHFFDTDFIKKLIDLLASYKLNRFHWHLTDDQGWRIESTQFPRLTEIGGYRGSDSGGRYGGSYTQDEIREIVAYAQARGVTVVPEIDLPGHTLALLAACPDLSCTGGPFEVARTWGVFDDVLCPGKEASYAFVEALLTELAGLFPGEYFHIGGDECPTVRFAFCPDCQASIRNKGIGGVDGLQPYFTGRLNDILTGLGKRLIGWDEIADRGLPTGATVMAWRGADRGGAAAQAGHDVIMCPTSHCYFDYYQAETGEPKAIGGLLPLEKVYEFTPVSAGTDFPIADRIIGGQANVWTEHMPTPEQVEYMTLPRLCALAERLWSRPDSSDFDQFKRRLVPHLKRLERAGYNYRRLDPA